MKTATGKRRYSPTEGATAGLNTGDDGCGTGSARECARGNRQVSEPSKDQKESPRTHRGPRRHHRAIARTETAQASGINAVKLFADLMTAIDEAYLGRAALPANPYDNPAIELARIASAARRFRKVLCDQENSLGAHHLLHMFNPGAFRNSKGEWGEGLSKALKIDAIIEHGTVSKFLKKEAMEILENGRIEIGSVEWFARVTFPPIFESYFGEKPMYSLDT